MNLRKAWRVAKRKRPDAIIFLGDMMDNGFADMHITECVYLPVLITPFFLLPSFSSLKYLSFLSFPPAPPLRHVYCRYQEYVTRFHSIFPTPPSVPVYYIPGNHDIGLGDRSNLSSLARPRYRSAFGPLTQLVKLGGHSLFMIDAPALVDEDLRRERAVEQGRANGLPQELQYLQHMRADQEASGYLVRSRLCSFDY
jgi:ethanolamine phosphate phosphodiesterase